MIEDHWDLFGPGDVPGYLCAEDIPAIEILSKKIKPDGTLVEIGAFLGKSSVEWAKHLPNSILAVLQDLVPHYSNVS